MKEKVSYHKDPLEVVYDDERWATLRSLRERALAIQDALPESFIHGSVARGDVKKTSDIDLIIFEQVPSYEVEYALSSKGVAYQSREIVQACPNSVPKAHVHIDDSTTITFPLLKMTSSEEEFYKFGGLISKKQARSKARVPGVNKRLELIIPTEKGHIEEGIIGKETATSRRLGISLDIVTERIRVLTRRDKVGRTGVYIKNKLSESESFEEVLASLADSDPAMKRQIKYRTGK